MDATRVQFVWFAGPVARLDASDVFGQLTGGEPANYSVQTVPGGKVGNANGVLEELNYEIGVHPLRLDISVSSTALGPTGFPAPIPNTEIMARDLLTRIAKVAEGWGEPTRLSVILHLAEAVETLALGFRKILDATGLPLAFDDGSDLTVQVNRRKPLKSVSGLSANRLVRFDMTAFRSVALSSGAHPTTLGGPETYFVNMQVDVNSVPDGTAIPAASAVAVWSELLEEALRLKGAGALSSLAVQP